MKMDMFEKVEKLREKANVSYEEAKAALEEAQGDMLDAMIILEKRGKTAAPKQESYSTRYEDNKNEIHELKAQNRKERNEKAKKEFKNIGEKLQDLLNKSLANFLKIEKDGKEIVKLPILAVILVLLLTWYVTIIAFIVSLFFGFHYSFVGEDNMNAANSAADVVEDVAHQVKDRVVEEYNKYQENKENKEN